MSATGQSGGDTHSKIAHSGGRNSQHARLMIAEEAARIIADEGIRDYQHAKRKAGDRLGFSDSRWLPSNQEIETALSERLKLFHGDETRRRVGEQLARATDAMTWLAAFAPRLTGTLLKGYTTETAVAELHLFARTEEDVSVFLIDNDIEHELYDKRIRFGGNRYKKHMGIRIDTDTIQIDAVVFPVEGLREAPLSPVDGQPMERANLEQVRALAEEFGGDES
jgi:hypothetical protein